MATRIYRAAHGTLLGSFLERGLLCRRRVLDAGIAFQSISNEDIEARRARTAVPCGLGGTLHDYVPFHFGPRSPMMYRLSCRNLPHYTEGQRPLIYLVSSVEQITGAGLPCVITDGHPLAAFTDFHPGLTGLDHVDLPLMTERIWKNSTADPDRERRRQAELLVHGRVPWEVIEEIGVMDRQVKQRVEEIFQGAGVPHRPPVAVRTAWYCRERP